MVRDADTTPFGVSTIPCVLLIGTPMGSDSSSSEYDVIVGSLGC